MSLDVPQVVLDQAERGEVDEADFVDCVRGSLPYAWPRSVAWWASFKSTEEFADNQTHNHFGLANGIFGQLAAGGDAGTFRPVNQHRTRRWARQSDRKTP